MENNKQFEAPIRSLHNVMDVELTNKDTKNFDVIRDDKNNIIRIFIKEDREIYLEQKNITINAKEIRISPTMNGCIIKFILEDNPGNLDPKSETQIAELVYEDICTKVILESFGSYVNVFFQIP